MNYARYQFNVHDAGVKQAYFDPMLLIIYLTLVSIGMIAVYSATIAQAFETGDPFIFLRKNAIHITLALSAMAVVACIPVTVWKSLSIPLLIFGIGLLILVLIPSIGIEINGSMRWIRIAGWQFQPSEFAELAFLVFASRYLSARRYRLNRFVVDVAPILGVFSLYVLLLLMEPDFGSVAVLGAMLVGILYLSGMRLLHLGLFVSAGVLGLVALIIDEPYRLQRVKNFIDPWQDPYGSGFQLVQSLIAFGRGELFGVGLGTSVQKLFYLPYAGSDFLLAVIAEELGFAGVLLIILLFVMLIWKIFHIAWSAAAIGDYFSCTLAQSIALLIAISALINMGVNMGVLPTKGLTLPFMSEGGTSLIAYSIAIGMVFSIERNTRQESAK